MPMQVSIINNSTTNNVTSTNTNNDKISIYYQSLSTRGDTFKGGITNYQDYLLSYDHDSNVERLLNFNNKYELFIHRITDINPSELYIDSYGTTYDYLSYQPISLIDLIINSTDGYSISDDFWIILDFRFRITDDTDKKSYIESTAVSYVFGGIDSDIDSIVNVSKYKFTTRNVTPKLLIDTIIKSLENNLQEKYKEDNIVGLYTRINESTIRLVNNCGVVSNYDIFKINNLDTSQYSNSNSYAVYISNSANQNIGIIFNYDTYINKFIITYRLYDENDELIYSTDTRVSELTNITIDDNLTIELGDQYDVFYNNIVNKDSNLVGKEFRLYRKKVYSDKSQYFDKLSELGEINSTFDIAIDPTVIDSNNINYNSNRWARGILQYKPTIVVLTSDNYYNDRNIASFNPRYFTIQDSDTRLPSYYLFLAMYPNRYVELVDQISFNSTDYSRSNGINIFKTNYGYEIDNPSTVRSLNSMIRIAHICRLITNRTYSTMNDVQSYVIGLGCSVLSYTDDTIHIRLLVDDIVRELNIEVTLNE